MRLSAGELLLFSLLRPPPSPSGLKAEVRAPHIPAARHMARSPSPRAVALTRRRLQRNPRPWVTWAAWESGDEDDVRRWGHLRFQGPYGPERVPVEMHPHAGVHLPGDSDDEPPDWDADAGSGDACDAGSGDACYAGSGAACWVALSWGCALLGCLGVGLYWVLLARALR